KLVDGVLHQVELVTAALAADTAHADVPVRGALCFVEADWPLVGGSFSTRGVGVMWPKRLAKQLQLPGFLGESEIEQVHRSLAAAFPPA
ncbi:MAG: NERD domain-containing protein, partial [Nocardioidaceae bacterium]